MRIEFERFLTITAMLAGAGAAALGCQSEDVSTDTNDSGVVGAGGKGTGGKGGSAGTATTGGTGGSSAGGTGGSSAGGTGGSSTGGSAGYSASGGSAGAAEDGSAGQAGASGAAGSAGSAGSDAGACLGDTASTTPDGGFEGICATLPYALDACTPDGGVEGSPLGADLCWYLEPGTGVAPAREGVFAELFDCLSAISGTDHCLPWHDDAVQDCLDTVFPEACQAGDIPGADGGTVNCTTIAATCPPSTDGGTTGLTVDECNDTLNAFTDAARLQIAQCYDVPQTSDCRDDFLACAFALP